jgi:hypothetical protein
VTEAAVPAASLIQTLVVIIFASTPIGCILGFCGGAIHSEVILVGVFRSRLTLALLTVRVLGFPFENTLRLPSRDLNGTLEKVDHLLAVPPPHGSAPE